MKKFITILAVSVMSLCLTSCFKQGTALTISPTSVTLKVGESVQLHPGMEGDGIQFSDIVRINPADGVCFLDSSYILRGLTPGNSRVGVGVLNDKNDLSKGYRYKAYTDVRVIE